MGPKGHDWESKQYLAELTLDDDVIAGIAELVQRRTYSGLEGVPGSWPTNSWELDGAEHRARTLWEGVPVYPIEADLFENDAGHRQLPPVTCLALLVFRLTAIETGFRSLLAVVYFQDDIHPPMSDQNLRKLRSSSWRDVAEAREMD